MIEDEVLSVPFEFEHENDDEALVIGQIRGDLSMLIGQENELGDTALPVSLSCTLNGYTATVRITNTYFRGFMDCALDLPIVGKHTLEQTRQLLIHFKHDSRLLVLKDLHRQLQDRWIMLGQMIEVRDDFYAAEKQLGSFGRGKESSRTWQFRIERGLGEDHICVAWSRLWPESCLENWVKFMKSAILTLELLEDVRVKQVAI
jgi:hypothetical protein